MMGWSASAAAAGRKRRLRGRRAVAGRRRAARSGMPAAEIGFQILLVVYL